jgi:hypothetical protein
MKDEQMEDYDDWRTENRRSANGGQTARVVGLTLLGVAALFAVGYLIFFLTMGPGQAIRKLDAQIDRAVNQESQQYVETRVRAMRDQITKYNENAVEMARLERDPDNAKVAETMQTQQAGILAMIRAQARELSEESLPADVRAFLSAH